MLSQSGPEKVISRTGVSWLKVRLRGAQRFVLNGLTAVRECEGNRGYYVRKLNLSPPPGTKKMGGSLPHGHVQVNCG